MGQNLEKPGYQFDGWLDAAMGVRGMSEDEVRVISDMHFVA